MRYRLLFCLLVLGVSLGAQPFYTASFDADEEGYTLTPAATFRFDPDGEAQGAAVWGQRSRIRSESRGGSLTFEGQGDVAQVQSGEVPVQGGTGDPLYITFYQYFKAASGGVIRLTVTADNGFVFEQIVTPRLGNDGETSAGSYKVFQLPPEFQEAFSVQIAFDLVNGGADFYILDDIQLWRQRPPLVTFPRYFGEFLTQVGTPFIVDSVGAPAVPFQLVADFLPGISEAERAVLRDAIDATVVQSCVCDQLEIWEMPGGLFFDPITGAPLGDPSDILERTLPGMAEAEVDGLELNYFNYNELSSALPGANTSLTEADVAIFPPAPDNAIKIAVLDTGLDLDHPDLAGYVFRDADTPGDNVDNDDDCLTDNPVGWNYVNNNNNPDDDNSHGTHVAGIVARNLNLCDDCAIQIIPYKTHNSNGVGTLFATACATLQAAVVDEVDVINDSWGFYGGGTEGVLRNAIDTAVSYGVVIVAAAGNDSLFLDADPQYPALYPVSNIIAVGAHDTLPATTKPPADFTNFSNTFVDLAAFGVNVESSLPGGGTGLKSGTSMSTPMVAATAALYVCDPAGGATAYRDFLLNNATKETLLEDKIREGYALNAEVFCDKMIVEQEEGVMANFSICFSPVTGLLDIRPFQQQGETTIRVFGLTGGLFANGMFRNLPAGESQLFSLEQAPPGVYLLVIEQNGRRLTRRLVKR